MREKTYDLNTVITSGVTGLLVGMTASACVTFLVNKYRRPRGSIRQPNF